MLLQQLEQQLFVSAGQRELWGVYFNHQYRAYLRQKTFGTSQNLKLKPLDVDLDEGWWSKLVKQHVDLPHRNIHFANWLSRIIITVYLCYLFNE